MTAKMIPISTIETTTVLRMTHTGWSLPKSWNHRWNNRISRCHTSRLACPSCMQQPLSTACRRTKAHSSISWLVLTAPSTNNQTIALFSCHAAKFNGRNLSRTPKKVTSIISYRSTMLHLVRSQWHKSDWKAVGSAADWKVNSKCTRLSWRAINERKLCNRCVIKRSKCKRQEIYLHTKVKHRSGLRYTRFWPSESSSPWAQRGPKRRTLLTWAGWKENETLSSTASWNRIIIKMRITSFKQRKGA